MNYVPINSIAKKFSATILILSFVLSSLLPILPKKAEAQFFNVVYDPTNAAIEGAESTSRTLKQFLDAAARIAAQIAIQRIVSSTVQWANTGFEGNPAYVTNPTQFFTGIADGVAGKYIQGSDLGFLCSPFQADIRLSLAQEYYQPRQFQCTISDIVENIEDFYSDFSAGGWDAWFSMTQNSSNNPYGAYLEAKIELDSRIASALGLQREQLSWNSGYLSWATCEREDPNTGECLERGPIRTPGAHIKSQLDQVLPSGLNSLLKVEHVEDLMEAFAVGLLQRYVFGPQGLYSGESVAQTTNPTFNRPIDIDGDGIADGVDTNNDNQPDICYFGGVSGLNTPPCRGSRDQSRPPYIPPPPTTPPDGGGQCDSGSGAYESVVWDAANAVMADNPALADSLNTTANGREFMALLVSELESRGYNATDQVLNGNNIFHHEDLIAVWRDGDSGMERYDVIISAGGGNQRMAVSISAQFTGVIPFNCTADGGGTNCADPCAGGGGGTQPPQDPTQPPTNPGVPVISSVSPTIVAPGGTLAIDGTNLTATVQFFDSSNGRYTVLGTVNTQGTRTTVTVPIELPNGFATVRIYRDALVQSEGRLIQVSNAGGGGTIPTTNPLTTWTPPQTSNGWWPTISPNGRYVTYGNFGESWVTDLTTGQTWDFRDPADIASTPHRCLAGHWMSDTTLTFVCEIDEPNFYRYEVTVGEWIPRRTADNPTLLWSSRFLASDGHWATYLAGGQFRLVRDNQVLAYGIGGAMSMRGDRIVHACTNDNQTICVRDGGLLTRTYPTLVPYHESATNNGYIMYGGYGPVRGINPFGTDINLRLSTNFNEHPQDIVMVSGSPWVVTSGWRTQGEGNYIFIRPWGSTTAIAIAANAVHVRARAVGSNFVVSYNSDTGQLTVITVPINSPRTTIN